VIVDRDTAAYIVFAEDDIIAALRKVNANKRGFVLCVSASGQVQGVLTDGDVRRWLVGGGEFDFSTTALSVANRDFISVREETDDSAMRSRFSDRVSFLPVVDAHNHLIAIAWKDSDSMTIAGRKIGPDDPA